MVDDDGKDNVDIFFINDVGKDGQRQSAVPTAM